MVQIKDFRILLELPAEACGIGKNMGLSDGGAGYVLGKMIELGLIDKVKAKEIRFSKTKNIDGRKMVFVLTERGRKLTGVLQEVFRILDNTE